MARKRRAVTPEPSPVRAAPSPSPSDSDCFSDDASKPQAPISGALRTVQIAGYIAVQLPASGSHPASASRWVYLRPHAPGVLFLANLPASTSVTDVRRAVPAASADNAAVEVRTMPASATRFARVKLRGGEGDVKAALTAPEDWVAFESLAAAESDTGDNGQEYEECKDAEVASGVRRRKARNPAEDWLRAYWAARDVDAIAQWSTATMETYERREAARVARERAEAADLSQPDDDGFVVVRRGAGAVDAASGVGIAAFNPVIAKKRASTTKRKRATRGEETGIATDGFYRWQRRETKKRQVDDLRKRFEQDKKRVAAVKNLKVDE
jgi:hypothetical protein